jgi:hypothetical protein
MDDELRALVRELSSLQDELERLWYRDDDLAVAQRRRIKRQREAAARRLIALGRDPARRQPRAAR